jgi:hypothetical protein
MKQSGIQGEGLEYPFGELVVAMADLLEGRQSDLLKPIPRRTTTPGKGFANEQIMLRAALAIEELIEAGETLPNAGAKVARTIKAAKLSVKPRRGANLISTVLGWRDRFRQGHESIADAAHEMWRADRDGGKLRHGNTPRARADSHLEMLRKMPVLGWR